MSEKPTKRESRRERNVPASEVPPRETSAAANLETRNRKKSYPSTAGLIDDVSGDKEFAKRLKKKLAERNIIVMLVGLRAAQGLSQQDIALKMGCTQSRVSKLENGTDDDLRIGDFNAYADTLGLELMILLGKKNQRRTAVDQVKHHAFSIRRLLRQMAKIAANDETIATGVKAFFREAALNLVNIVGEATKIVVSAADNKIVRNLPEKERPRIQLEDEEALDADECSQSSNANDPISDTAGASA